MPEPLICPHCSELLTDAQLKVLWGRHSSAQRKTKEGGKGGGRWRDIESGDEPPIAARLAGKDVFYGKTGPCMWDGVRRDDNGRPRLMFTEIGGDDYYIRQWRNGTAPRGSAKAGRPAEPAIDKVCEGVDARKVHRALYLHDPQERRFIPIDDL